MWSENTLCMILSISNLVRFILGSRCGLSLFMFHGHLARACLWLFLCGMFRKCGLDSAEGVNEPSVSLLVLCLAVLSAGKVGAEASVHALRLPTFLASPWFYFTHFVAPLLSTYRHTSVIELHFICVRNHSFGQALTNR